MMQFTIAIARLGDVQMWQAGYQCGANSQGLLDASRVDRV